MDQLVDSEGHGDRCRRNHVWNCVEGPDLLRCPHRFLRDRLTARVLTRNDVHADVAGATHQVVHDRAVQDFEPTRARRFADNDLGDVVGMREIHHVVGDTPAPARNSDRLAPECLRQPQRIGDAVALFLGELQAARRLDAQCRPGRVQAVRETLGVAHQAGRSRVLADAYQNALARRPRTLDGMLLHVVKQLLVYPVGCAPQRQFAQCRQVGWREEMLKRALGLLGDVDFALFQTLDQVVRRQIDQLDRIGAVEHRVGNGFAHPYAGDLRNDVVEALDVLDVDRGIDVDAAVEQLFDIHATLGMPAAGRVGVREFIDQHDLRPARDDGVEIHLLEPLATVLDAPAWNDLETFQQRFGFLAAVRLDDSDYNIVAVLAPGAGSLQHGVGLADPGRCTDEDPQLSGAAFFAPGGFEQGLRRRPLIALLICHRPLCASPLAESASSISRHPAPC